MGISEDADDGDASTQVRTWSPKLSVMEDAGTISAPLTLYKEEHEGNQEISVILLLLSRVMWEGRRSPG